MGDYNLGDPQSNDGGKNEYETLSIVSLIVVGRHYCEGDHLE
jgi:hypothetical protein